MPKNLIAYLIIYLKFRMMYLNNNISLLSSFSSKNMVVILTIIGVISLIFKLYLADFSTPVFSDALEYTQHSIAQSQGQFLQHPQRHSGWPLFQTVFMNLINSNNFLDYSNISKILSISISSLTIIPVYFLSKKFFNPGLSLLAVGFFAFEPRLIQNSTLGFSEPLFILVMVSSIYFITKNETKFIVLSFILAAILWWIRPNGFILFFIISIIYFAKVRFNFISIRNFLIFALIFSLIVTPLLLQRYDQFGDPMYNWIGERIWVGEYSHSRSISPGESYSSIDFINDFGIQSFFERFVSNGIYTLSSTLSYMMLPFLIFLTPLGIILCIKKQISKLGFSPIWITLLVSLLASIIPFAVIPDKRLILYLFPFLIIFAIIPINHYFDKFSFSRNNSKISLLIIFAVLIVISSFMISRYELSDITSEQEQINFTKHLYQNFEGKLLFEPYNTQKYFNHPSLYEDKTDFLSIKINEDWKDGETFFDYPDIKFSRISIFGNDMHEFLENGEKDGLTHVMATSQNTSFFNFINDLYLNDEQYTFLKKVYDSDDFDHKKFHVKVFEIDYIEFETFKKNSTD